MEEATGEVFFDIPVEISSELDRKIYDAFKVYDSQCVNMVDASNVGNILRFLGCVPSVQDIEEIVKLTEFPNHPGNVHFAHFLPVLKRLLAEEQLKPQTPEVLLDAFKLFDPKNRGYIRRGEMSEIIKSFGEGMSEDEVDEMMKMAVDPSNDCIVYEDFINCIAHEPKASDSVYTLMKMEVKQRENAAKQREVKRRMTKMKK